MVFVEEWVHVSPSFPEPSHLPSFVTNHFLVLVSPFLLLSVIIDSLIGKFDSLTQLNHLQRFYSQITLYS